MIDLVPTYDGQAVMHGVVFSLALSLLVRIRIVAVAMGLTLAAAALWAMFLAPGGPVAAVDLMAERLGALVSSGFWLGLASAGAVAHWLASLVRHARRGRRNRRMH